MFITFIIRIIYISYFDKYLLKRIKQQSKSNFSFTYPDISVIICAKNESVNLTHNLPYILNQNYPGNFEVIVVNDSSTDDTEYILLNLKKKYNKLNYVKTNSYNKILKGKKLALSIGIKAAKYDRFIMTDADCIPAGNEWLKLMSQGFANNKQIVLGVGLYKPSSGFINAWQRYDTYKIATLYLAFAIRGIPYMGVGRNIGYTRKLYNKVGGFVSHANLLSGDDDLFVRDAADKNNVSIVTNPNSFTFSDSCKTFKSWRIQKKRHLSTSPIYKLKIKILLSLETLSIQIFTILSIISIFFIKFAPISILLIFTLNAYQYNIHKNIMNIWNEKYNIYLGVIFRIFIPIVIGFLMFNKNKRGERKWN